MDKLFKFLRTEHGQYNMQIEEVTSAELEFEITKFHKNSSNENLVELLNKILKARLVVPCQIRVEPGYEDVVNNLKKGDSLHELEGVHFVSEILVASNGTRWIPYFTTGLMMPKKYLAEYSKMDYKFTDICNQALLDNKDITGIVINPYNESFYMDKTMLKLMLDAINEKNNEE